MSRAVWVVEIRRHGYPWLPLSSAGTRNTARWEAGTLTSAEWCARVVKYVPAPAKPRKKKRAGGGK